MRPAIGILLLVLVLVGGSAVAAETFHTTVAPRDGEDIAEPCKYELTLLDPSKRIEGVWVIFERSAGTLQGHVGWRELVGGVGCCRAARGGTRGDAAVWVVANRAVCEAVAVVCDDARASGHAATLRQVAALRVRC